MCEVTNEIFFHSKSFNAMHVIIVVSIFTHSLHLMPRLENMWSFTFTFSVSRTYRNSIFAQDNKTLNKFTLSHNRRDICVVWKNKHSCAETLFILRSLTIITERNTKHSRIHDPLCHTVNGIHFVTIPTSFCGLICPRTPTTDKYAQALLTFDDIKKRVMVDTHAINIKKRILDRSLEYFSVW